MGRRGCFIRMETVLNIYLLFKLLTSMSLPIKLLRCDMKKNTTLRRAFSFNDGRVTKYPLILKKWQSKFSMMDEETWKYPIETKKKNKEVGGGDLDFAEASRYRCHRVVRLSIHFIRNAFAITLRCPGHGLSNGAVRPRERLRNAMCVQHKWPSANINNRRGKYTVCDDARFSSLSIPALPARGGLFGAR